MWWLLSAKSTELHTTSAGWLTAYCPWTPTCWAHTIGVVVHLAMSRIVGRDDGEPDFSTIKARLSRVMRSPGFDAISHGANVSEALGKFVDEYRLDFRECSIAEARQALNHGWPSVARFELYNDEWDRFQAFFTRERTGVLTRDDVLGMLPRRPLHVSAVTHPHMVGCCSRPR